VADSPELFSRALMARSLAYLFTGGALVGCLTLVFPHDSAVRDGPLYGLAALAITVGLVILWRSHTVPAWALHVALVVGSLILAAANYFVGPSALYLTIFTWTGLYAFYFYRPPIALAHLALIGVAYMVVLVIQEPPSPVVRWILAIGTPGLAGMMISTLLNRLRLEASQAARQELVLRESEARTRAIVESAPNAYMALSEEGFVIAWNPAAREMFGWSTEEATGKTLRELGLLVPGDEDGHDERRRQLVESPDGDQSPSRAEVALRRRNGEEFLADRTVTRIRIGDRYLLVCFLEDISDRERREQERQALYREQAAREEAEQMAGIVHGLQMLLDVALAHNRLNEMLTALLPRVCEVVEAEAAAVLLTEEDGSLTLQASMFAPVGEEPLRIAPGEGLAGRVVRDKQPLLVQDPDPSEVADPALHGVHSILSVPLLAGSTVTGVLQVGVPAPRRFSEDDILLLGLAADRVALAVDHLRIYEREHRIAETLQRSLLPERLPRLPGLEAAARYLPAASESEVGGDWYDVIAMPGGRVGLVMGDVAGKGLAAASMVGRLRSAMRAYALDGHGPAGVVERLNQLVWSEEEHGQMTTLVYVVVDPWEGRLAWVNAGHLPPLVVSRDGETSFLEGPSSVPLGVMSFPSYATAQAELPLGGTVLLYTDGLVERPGELLDVGLERLASSVSMSTGPEGLCERLIDSLVPGGAASDDVALLALRTPVLSDAFTLELGADPGEMAAMRAMMRRWLRQVDATDLEVSEILTATGEAAANAIEHGGAVTSGTPFEVTGRLDGERVEITVRDSGTWRKGTRAEGGRGLVLMRALMHEVDVTPGTRGTVVRLVRRIGEPVRQIGEGAALRVAPEPTA
jgi:PAS domain S-box-containing protein